MAIIIKYNAMNTLKIGWIGLGNMGNPMVQNLLKAGYSVTVFNRSKDKEVPLIALEPATSPKELIETCDLVITMLSNDAAVKEVFANEKDCFFL
jgi:3-hydroxyisobutyrate dehydrogenase